MRQRRVLKGLAVLLGLALVAAACGDDDDDSATDTTEEGGGGGGAATDFTACEVTDTGGVDDRSFNQTAYKGVQDAADELGFEPAVLESQAESDFAPQRLIQEMKRRTPQMASHEVADTGHMPMLMDANEIDAIATFLSKH